MTVDSPKGAPETELKFRLGAGALTALANHPTLSKPGRKSRLRSVYFDTPEHDLRNAGYSLRVREKDGAYVQTVKRTGEGGGIRRDEWEFLVEGVKVDLAALDKTPAGALLNGGSERLTPMFETRIDRTVSLWDDAADMQAYEQSPLYREIMAPLQPFFVGDYKTYRCEVKYTDVGA